MSIEEKQNFPTYLDSENIKYPQNEREVSNYIKENYFNIYFSMTLNEKWFNKRKIQ